MGNWRTVSLRGTIAADDLPAARSFIDPGEDLENFHCLSGGEGLCGIGDWVAEEIQADGNLAERDFSVQDVADVLRQMVKKVPSLTLKVHCGGEYEDRHAVATITVALAKVTVGPPEVTTVWGVDEATMRERMMRAVLRGGQ